MSGSDYVLTPNLGLYKPTVDADEDQWGSHWNFNADTLDSVLSTSTGGTFLPIAGGTMLGQLVLWGQPASPNDAASKAYVDANAPPPAGNAPPNMDGASNPGTANAYAREDHRHPTDTTRYAASNPAGYITSAPLANYLPLTGGTMQGTLTLQGAPSGTNDAATKAYVDSKAGGASLTVADTPPAIAQGSMWFDSIGTQLYVGYVDPSGPGQWVIANNAGNLSATAIIGDAAPTGVSAGALWWDSTGGNLYVRYQDPDNASWVAATNTAGLANAASKADVAQALNNVGRNLLHNSMFNIWQRGNGAFGGNAYMADRWFNAVSGDTFSSSRYNYSDSERVVIGDEAARSCALVSVTGTAVATAYSALQQSIEGVTRLSGKTVTVSFWANGSVGGLRLGVSLDQGFGSGGSPSAVVLNTGQSVTITSTQVRYSLTFALPSTSGKTLGTNGDDRTVLNLWFSTGANSANRSGNVGVQSGSFAIWGVQLEIAQAGQTQPTPLEKPDPELQLRQCQRFYCVGQIINGGYSIGASGAFASALYVVQMRVTPTLAISSNNSNNMGAISINPMSNGFYVTGNSTAAGGYIINVNFTASADL